MTPSGRRPPSPSPGGGPPFPLFLNEKDMMMAKILVLYYSSYVHIEQMADVVAQGARAAGAEVDLRPVAETAPQAVVKAAGFKTATAHPLLGAPNELVN